MAKFKRRVFHIKIPPEARRDLDKFIERLSESIKSYGGLVRLTDNNTLRVEIYGDGSMIRDSWIRIRNLLKEYQSSEIKRDMKTYNAKRLYKEIGLAIPLDVLEEVLKAKGHKAEIREEVIVTNTDFEEIIDFGLEIKRALEDLRFVDTTRTAKKLIAATAAITGRSVDDIINMGLDLGVLVEEDNGKISVISPWKDVLKKLVRVLGSEQFT